MENAAAPPAALRRRPPGWLAVGVALALSYVVAAFAVVLLGGLLNWIGLLPLVQGPMPWRHGLLSWPYPEAGAWAAVADVTLTFATIAIVGGVLWVGLRSQLGGRVSLIGICCALTATGCVPGTPYNGPFGLHGFGGFMVTVALVKWLAVGRSDATLRARVRGWLPPARLSGRTGIALAGALAATAVAAAVAYGPSHPLWLHTSMPYPPRAGKVVVVQLSFANRGPADTTILRIASPDHRFVIARTFARDVWLPPGRVLRECANCGPQRNAPPLRDLTVASGATRDASLWIHVPRCADGVPPTLRRITVIYSVLARTLTTSVPLSEPIAGRC